MLKTLLPIEHIQMVEAVEDWQEAIMLSAKPLLDGGFITPSYVQKIFEEYENSGPFFVIAPGIAVPHARPEDGVVQQGLSLVAVKNGVRFDGEDDAVRLVVMLCATDKHSHVALLSALSEMFADPETVMALSQADSVAQMASLIENF